MKRVCNSLSYLLNSEMDTPVKAKQNQNCV